MAGILDAANATIDAALSFVQDLNQQASDQLDALRANRARYNTVVRQVSSLPTPEAQAAARTALTAFIHDQVDNENRYQDFQGKFSQAKAMLKQFIQDVGLTPPEYLGLLPAGVLVPAAIIAAALAAAAVIALIAQHNAAQGKALDDVADVIALAQAQNWTPDQTTQAIQQVRQAAAPPDAFGITGILQAALPVIVIGTVLVIASKMRRRAA